jgi:deoxyribodipyrimidine photo-lyase
MHPRPSFPTTYTEILDRLRSFNPGTYAATRNSFSGSVSFLSPYLTHGVLTLPQVVAEIEKATDRRLPEKFLQELTWREYYRRQWYVYREKIWENLRQRQYKLDRTSLPSAIINADTGIAALDDAIAALYETGYMHNHARMWLAAGVCNFCGTAWQEGAAWLYYHLLDGDMASNCLSWQWVAAASRTQPYMMNQENIDRYSGMVQRGSWLDVSYEQLESIHIPPRFSEHTPPVLVPNFPQTTLQGALESNQRVLLYSPWTLDPTWRSTETGRRIVVFDHQHFTQYPISERRLRFIMGLCQNIPGVEIYVGDVADLPGLAEANIVVRDHPLHAAYPATIERDEDPLLHAWQGNVPNSFMAYWKKLGHY